jgi:hypothetical protein
MSARRPELDESQFKRFPNVYEFTKDIYTVKMYPRQLSLMLQMHGDVCLYCSDKQFLLDMYDETNDVIESKLTFLVHGRCPKCGKTKSDHIKDRLWLAPNKLLLNAGQRSGKATLIAALSLYAEHQMLTIDDEDGKRIAPADLFPLSVDTVFRNSLVGSSYDESIYLYSLVEGLRESSKWYQGYLNFLDCASARNGCSYYEDTDYSIKYLHKNIVTLCEHATSPNQLRGHTRYFVGLGDFAWFDGGDEKAIGIWNASGISLTTAILKSDADYAVLADTSVKPMMVCGTTSRETVDFNSKVAEFNLLNMRTLMRTYATWEFSPLYKFDDYKDEFNKNFQSANRDFACYKLQHIDTEIKG